MKRLKTCPETKAVGALARALTLALLVGLTGLMGCGGGGATNAPVPASTATPAITTQPLSQTVKQNLAASFSVVATGTAPLSYQWKKEGANLNGATTATYTLASAQLGDAGIYTVTVSNATGTATSAGAVLTVNPLPVVESFAVGPQTIGIGAAAVLSWKVTGATAVSIDQGVGTFTETIGTKNVSPALTTTYTLTASGLGGSVTATATLTVDITPFQITSFSATPTQVNFGEAATLNWMYTGLPVSLTLDGASLSGASSSIQPVRRQTFVLEGGNSAGTDRRTVTVAARGVDLVAGNPTGGAGSLEGTGPAALFNGPSGVAVDGKGNVYVTDTYNHTIRKVTPTGVVTTFAGKSGFLGTADGTGSTARFHSPSGIAIDASGNLFVSDTENHTIRKVTPAGVVTTLAGMPGLMGSWDGLGSAAGFSFPYGVAVDGSGNLYVAETYNQTIRKVMPDGLVTTLAGSLRTSGAADGTGSAATFNSPAGVAVDASGNVYVADSQNATIRKVTSAGVVTTFVGTAGIKGHTDGMGAAASFTYPTDLTKDASGNLYVMDGGTIRKVTPAGVVTTIAGTAGIRGSADGPAATASFSSANGLTMDDSGHIYVADHGNNAIRKLTSQGMVVTLAGDAGVSGSADGSGGTAGFTSPSGVSVDGSGNIFVADTGNHVIRKVTSRGVVTTLAGLARVAGNADGTGSAAGFRAPNGVAADGLGNVYVADTKNHAIRKVTSAGLVTTLAGSPGNKGKTDGTGSAARFNYPFGLAMDGSGNILVADMDNHAIRKVTPAGEVSTVAGAPGMIGRTDGTGSAAKFYYPVGVTVDGAGNTYVADSFNNSIRKVTPEGVVTTLAGSPLGDFGATDGLGSAARFNWPNGVAVDGSGNVYVADAINSLIRKVTPAGMVTTVVGNVEKMGYIPGSLPTSLNHPLGVAVTPEGDLIVTCVNGIIQITAP